MLPDGILHISHSQLAFGIHCNSSSGVITETTQPESGPPEGTTRNFWQQVSLLDAFTLPDILAKTTAMIATMQNNTIERFIPNLPAITF
jgi:hypothetical protein